MIRPLLLSAALLSLSGAALAAEPATKPLSPREILDAAPASDWRDIPADQLVVMTLADGHEVVYQLAPFSPQHTANIRTLITTGWFDGSAIIRVQENYVVQWGYADDPEPAYPAGVVANPDAEYDFAMKGKTFKKLKFRDPYARASGFVDTWPVATDGKAGWLVHCNGMIGVGRDLPPSTGSGSSLYVASGHAPRGLDRNLTVVGRVIGGMEWLTSRPRGTGPLGFYETPEERVKIVSVRLGSQIENPPAYKVLDPQSKTYDQWLHARVTGLNGGFLVTPPGGTDVCNAQPAVRKK